MTENNKKKMLEMYKKLWSEVKKQNECNSNESIKYEKDPMKIRVDSYDDGLPLNKILWLSDLKITERQISSPNLHS